MSHRSCQRAWRMRARVSSAAQPCSPSSRVVSSAHPAAGGTRRAAISVARGESPTAGRRPIDLVRACVTRVMAVVQSQPAGTTLSTPRRAQIRHIAEELFDFDEMARRALGQHWKDRSPQEQTEFVGLFVNLLEQSYLTAIGNFPSRRSPFRARVSAASTRTCGPASSPIGTRFPSTTDSCKVAGDGPCTTSWRTA